MSKKSEARKAAYIEARRRAVLPILLGMSVVIENAWTLEGKTEAGVAYAKLDMTPENKERVLKKWKQIVRWRDAVCEQDGTIVGTIRRNVLYRDMDGKFSRRERCISAHCESGRAPYNLALVVETIVISALLVDWMEEHGWVSTNEFYWFLCALNTFASWTCKPNDPVVLLANIVYYEMRDLFLEKPNWKAMYRNAPVSETTAWVRKNPDTEFGKAAKEIAEKYGGDGC